MDAQVEKCTVLGERVYTRLSVNDCPHNSRLGTHLELQPGECFAIAGAPPSDSPVDCDGRQNLFPTALDAIAGLVPSKHK